MNVYLATLESTHNPWTVQAVIVAADNEIQAATMASVHIMEVYGGLWSGPVVKQLTEPTVIASMVQA